MLPELEEEQQRIRIARRIALEFKDGDVVNLGIGIPTLVSDYIPEGIRVVFQTENGVVGAGPKPVTDDWRFIGAGGRCLSLQPGSALVSSEISFGLIRGGHIDHTVLGALQVDKDGNLASWWIPGKLVPGMGGSMDLVTGVKSVIVATSHTDKNGNPKIVSTCDFPLTGVGVVSLVVTEYAVFRFLKRRLVLCETAPQVEMKDIKKYTGAEFDVSDSLSLMKGCENE
ncbi:MAG: 3-oxoacid CoA-transferase subunit B [Spirochaetales bacterium]|nr:3-oxoacid CoA-transferase subunit B [Spirochaetales bacterium]